MKVRKSRKVSGSYHKPFRNNLNLNLPRTKNDPKNDQQKSGKILLVTPRDMESHVVAAIDVRNRVEPFFIIIKDSSVLYCWRFVMLATASHYLMLLSVKAITMLEC